MVCNQTAHHPMGEQQHKAYDYSTVQTQNNKRSIHM